MAVATAILIRDMILGNTEPASHWDMAWIPAGDFLMGSDPLSRRAAGARGLCARFLDRPLRGDQ